MKSLSKAGPRKHPSPQKPVHRHQDQDPTKRGVLYYRTAYLEPGCHEVSQSGGRREIIYRVKRASFWPSAVSYLFRLPEDRGGVRDGGGQTLSGINAETPRGVVCGLACFVLGDLKRPGKEAGAECRGIAATTRMILHGRIEQSLDTIVA